MFFLGNLKLLDGQEVTHIEKVKSDILFGADIEKTKQNFETFLPDEEFVDRRLFVAQQIDPESDSEEEYDMLEMEAKPLKVSKNNTIFTSKNHTKTERRR